MKTTQCYQNTYELKEKYQTHKKSLNLNLKVFLNRQTHSSIKIIFSLPGTVLEASVCESIYV